MSNPFLVRAGYEDDEEKKKKPSQIAAAQVKAKVAEATPTKNDNPFLARVEAEKKNPKSSYNYVAPVSTEKPVEPEKTTVQKVGDFVSNAASKVKSFFLGDEAKPAGNTDQRYAGYMEQVIKDNQEVDQLAKTTRQEIINYLRDNISEDSKARETVAKLTVENLDQYRGDIERILVNQYNYKVVGEEEVGKSIFKHKRKIRAGEGQANRDVYEKLDRLKALEYAKQDNDEFLGYETANKGIVRELIDNLKEFEYKVHPYSANRYQELVATNRREAIEKYQKGEELTDKDLAYIKSFRAEAFNNLVEKGMGTMAADVVTGSLGMGMQMYMDAQMTGNISQGAAPALAKLPLGKARPIIEKILGNTVQLAVQSNYNIPAMDAKTAQYMLPTVEYEKWLDENNKTDLLDNLKKGDEPGDARRKAYLTNLVDYVSEGVGDYIDDATPFVKKAFIGKFLKNRGITDPGEATKLLRTMHINSIIGEVIEEETGEPVQAYIEKRKYNDPFMTPEGRERLLVETLGIGSLLGMSKVTDTTIDGIRNVRSKTGEKNTIVIPVVRDEATTPKIPEATEVKKEEKIIPKELDTLASEAKGYTSAADFATIQGTNENSQIGVIPANRISARDTVDTNSQEYKDLKADIEKNGIKEPVIVTVKEDGTIETTEGSHRVTVAQDLGVNVPIIVTKGNVEGLNTIKDFYEEAAKVTKSPGLEKKPVKYDYSSTQLNLPKALSNQVMKFAATIPESSISTDGDNGGRETEPHITVVYGLDTQKEADVRPMVESTKPINVKMGKVSVFENDKFDVLKVDVSSPQLTALNKQISKNLDTPGKTFDDYKPHVTVAYLKKGEGKKFAGDTRFQGKSITLKELTFSKKDGTQVKIGLLGKPKKILKSVQAAPKIPQVEKPEKVTKTVQVKKVLKPKEAPKEPKRKFVSTIGKSRLAQGVRQKAIKNKLIYGFDKSFMDLPEYDKVNKKDQGRRAVEYLLNNPEEAVEVAMGQKQPPNGLLPESVFIAVENYAIQTKNVDLLRMLATESNLSLEATGMGQRISQLSERNPDSAVKRIHEVSEARARAAEKRLNKSVKKAVSDTVKEIKEQIKTPKKEDWASFVKSIEC